MATVKIPVSGLSQLAYAVSGGGNSAYQDAFNNEAAVQSKIAQSLAATRKANAEADAEIEAANNRRPESIRSNAMTALGIPEDAAPDVAEFQRGGYIGKYQLPANTAGPTMDQPEWVGKLGNLGRMIAATQNAVTLGDKNSLNAAKAYGELDNLNKQDRVLSGDLNASKLGQAVAAAAGKPMYKAQEYGVLNEFTGDLDTENPAAKRFGTYRDSETGKNKAQAVNSYASADQHRASADLSRSKIGQNQTTVMPDGSVVTSGGQGKPMPAAALKMQQEEMEAIGLASAIEKDLGAISQKLADGSLRLGPYENLKSQGLNAAGLSSENSRNFASFRSTLEKLRNDSLRLNKGVQTEGDAQRAWNEILANINDIPLVQQRLSEVQAINNRAIDLRKNNLNVIRNNYGAPPLDMRVYDNLKPAIAPGKQAAPVTVQNDAQYNALPSGAVFTGPDGKQRRKP